MEWKWISYNFTRILSFKYVERIQDFQGFDNPSEKFLEICQRYFVK